MIIETKISPTSKLEAGDIRIFTRFLSEDCYYCALVCVLDVLLNRICFESVDESLCLSTVFIAVSYCDNICICLSCITGSILNCESIAAVKTCCESIVAVDYCERACIAVVELSSNCISLNCNDIVAVVVSDIKSCYAVCCVCTLGKINESLLPEKEKCSCLVAVVSGDNDSCALCNVCNAVNAVSVKSERLVVDRSSCNQVSSVGLVIAVQIRCVLKIVSIKLAVRKSLVGKNIIIIDNDLKIIALLSKCILNEVQDLTVRCGCCAYLDNIVAVSSNRLFLVCERKCSRM